MRKYFLLVPLVAALTAFTRPASSTEITLYGVVDGYVAVNIAGSQLKSGIQSGGAKPSLWGIKGSEDLGNGWSSHFKLEAGFLLDNGEATPGGAGGGLAWHRESWLGVSNENFGSLSFGRQYTPYFLTMIMIDPTNMSLGGTIENFCWPGAASVLGGDLNKNIDLARRDNSFLYKTPSFKGLSAELFVSLGEQVKDSGKQSNSLGNSYSIALEYASHNVMLRGVYLYDKLSLKIQGEDHYQTVLFGGSYDLGVTKPSLIFLKKFAKGSPETPNLWAAQLGASTPLAGGKLFTTAAYLRNQTNKDENAWSFGLRYDYPLSKRTTIYAGYTAVINQKKSSYVVVPGAGSSLPFFADKAGLNAQQIFSGINISF